MLKHNFNRILFSNHLSTVLCIKSLDPGPSVQGWPLFVMPVRRLKVAGVGMEKPKLLCYVFIPPSLPPSLYIHTPCNLQYSLGVCLEFLVHCICLECLASVVCPPSYQGQDCIPMLHGAGGLQGDGGRDGLRKRGWLDQMKGNWVKELVDWSTSATF